MPEILIELLKKHLPRCKFHTLKFSKISPNLAFEWIAYLKPKRIEIKASEISPENLLNHLKFQFEES